MVSFQFHKNFSGPSFCDGWTKNLQTFSKQFFLERPSTYCIVEFTAIFMFCLLRWSKRYQWNKVATSLARDFNNGWPPYLNFSNMINLWPNIWFIKNSKCHQFLFWKRRRQKTKFLNIFKGPSFCNGWSYWYECWRVLRDFWELSKKCGFGTFPEI